jgi:hypothetical protein
VIWAIGKSDNSAVEFALAPAGHDKFLEKDFGWEDRYFLVGHSPAEKDWPYIMPRLIHFFSPGYLIRCYT